LKPYWGKPAVRNFREGDGNVGILRSPVRAIALPDLRARLLTDRGSGYVAAAFGDYLRALRIRHIYCAPHHPQTNGKLERVHETLKARLNLLVHTSPEILRAAMGGFIYLQPRAVP
jgi:transposase InsO family protein